MGVGVARRVGTGGGGRPCERFVLDAGDFCWRLSGARAVWQVRDGGGGLFALVGRDRRLECAASRRRGTGGGGFLANFPTVYAVLGARRRKRPFATWGNARQRLRDASFTLGISKQMAKNTPACCRGGSLAPARRRPRLGG